MAAIGDRAFCHEPGFAKSVGRAAHPAMAMPVLPGRDCLGIGEQRGVRLTDPREHFAQADVLVVGTELHLMLSDRYAECGVIADGAQQGKVFGIPRGPIELGA